MGELLRHSDSAMYQAKERGRNNCQVFSPIMDRRLKQRIAIETHLRLGARVTGNWTCTISPSSRSAAIRSSRSRPCCAGTIPPTATSRRRASSASPRRSGLIVPIGEFVLERVLLDATQWRKEGCALVPIAVNVSAAQLQRSNLAGAIVRLTQKYGFRARVPARRTHRGHDLRAPRRPQRGAPMKTPSPSCVTWASTSASMTSAPAIPVCRI